MKTFTIDAENHITVYASKKEAAAASATDVFATQEELAEPTTDWPMQRLVGIWNSLPGVNPISKFTSRKIAIERLWKGLQDLEITPVAKPEVSAPLAEPRETLPAEAEPVVEVPSIVEEQQPEVPSADVQVIEQPGEQVLTEAAAVAPESSAQVPELAPIAETPAQEPAPAKKARKARQKPATKEESGPREGSKTAQVVAMLQREGGATITEIIAYASHCTSLA